MNPMRLPPVPGEWIDRSHSIEFTFEASQFTGYAGDTITSALLASGQRILGRSFKYHRPRSVLSFANHDVNTLMQSGQQLNVRADITEIEPEMSLFAVNTTGGVMHDRASVIDFFAPFLPVGFYYKAFHQPRLFPLWERLIRALTGLGRIDPTAPRIRTPKRYGFCDVLIIGGGVSGLSAALSAATAGATVAIVDENPRFGGAGLYQLGGDFAQRQIVDQLVQAVSAHPNIRLYPETQAAAYYADRWIPLVERDRITKMRTKTVIVATGSYEQPAVFRNNDLPGVMLASAAQRLIYRYAVKPMNEAVILTANTEGYKAAIDLINQGITVKAIVDLRQAQSNEWINELRDRKVPILFEHCITEARSNSASDGVCAVRVCSINAESNTETIACDGVLMSVGWAAAANLLYQAGARMRFDRSLQQFIPEQLPDAIFACGRVNGVFEFGQKQLDGQRAGLQAADRAGFSGTTANTKCREAFAFTPIVETAHPYPIVKHPNGKNFVDFDEDLQLKDFENAIQEGFDNVELLKRYTTVGMGASQGKHSNLNALRILARTVGKTPGEVGTTTARPFVHPVPMSHLAGRGFVPERHTPLHDRHTELNAKFMLAGVWKRPEYYRKLGKTRSQCIHAEVETVRQRVGAIDVGTLGKFELRGADAAQFLERIYTGRFQNLKVGMTRYALMLDEAGTILDDGVVARLSDDRFYFTTTTAGATPIYRELSRLNTLWQLDCGLTNLTGARSAINLAGPQSRAALSEISDLDLAAFPYLGVREGTVAGISAIVMRVGFVGEWGYEIHVAAEYAGALWDALFEAGRSYDICPFGVEAQRILRLEKGHAIVGQDTDGLTTPIVANLQWAVKLDKPFFIGQRSLQVIAQRNAKQKLIGFMLDQNFDQTSPQECHLIINQTEIAGRITSIAWSPTLNRYIGLAYLKTELCEIGQLFSIRVTDGLMVNATVCETPFYDPDNARQKNAVVREELAV